MGIDGLSSGSYPGISAFRNAWAGLKAQAALSLMPSPPSAPSGPGLGPDIYTAVSKQAQGLYAASRTATYSAYAVLGIDNSQSASRNVQPEKTSVEAGQEAEPVQQPEQPAGTRNITDELLKESGYVQPEPNPYQVRTDFFA